MVRISANTSKPSNVHPRFEAISAFHCVRVSERYHGEWPEMADSFMIPSLRRVWVPIWQFAKVLRQAAVGETVLHEHVFTVAVSKSTQPVVQTLKRLSYEHTDPTRDQSAGRAHCSATSQPHRQVAC